MTKYFLVFAAFFAITLTVAFSSMGEEMPWMVRSLAIITLGSPVLTFAGTICLEKIQDRIERRRQGRRDRTFAQIDPTCVVDNERPCGRSQWDRG
jgi:hypothetical protein